MTWDYGDARDDDRRLPRRDRPTRPPGEMQDELRARPAGDIVHSDGGEMPLIGAPTPTSSVPAHRPTGREVAPGHKVQFNATFSDIKRSGNWVVPQHINANLVFGDMLLDLREAQLHPGENRIDVFSVFGDLRVLVPEGLRVETTGSTLAGDGSVELGSTPPQPGPYLRINMSGIFGDFKVLALAPGEKPKKRWRW